MSQNNLLLYLILFLSSCPFAKYDSIASEILEKSLLLISCDPHKTLISGVITVMCASISICSFFLHSCSSSKACLFLSSFCWAVGKTTSASCFLWADAVLETLVLKQEKLCLLSDVGLISDWGEEMWFWGSMRCGRFSPLIPFHTYINCLNTPPNHQDCFKSWYTHSSITSNKHTSPHRRRSTTQLYQQSTMITTL